MQQSYKSIFINSLLAFVSAFIITTIIHESGHFFAYLVAGAQPVLYHNYVQLSDNTLSLNIKVVAALAGPVISLGQGIIFSAIVIKKQENNARYLLCLWLSLLGFINFFGYLMLTPLSTKGDTGKVAEMLHMPYMYRIIVALLGIAILVVLVLKVGKYFANFIPAGTEIRAKGKYINYLVMFPIMAGSVVNMLLSLPIPVLLSIIYPATSSYVILTSYGRIMRTEPVSKNPSEVSQNISVFLVVVCVVCMLLNRLLTMGLG